MMRIRDYEAGDLDAVLLLNVETLQPGATAEQSGRFSPDLLEIAETYQRRGVFLIVEDAGEVVATGAVREDSAGIFELKRLRVALSHQRGGVARHLVAELEQRARTRGGRAIVLDTTDAQVPAQKLYESMGYTITHTSEATRPSGTFHLIHYRKDLDAG